MREKSASLADGVQVPDYFNYGFLKGNFFNNKGYPSGIWYSEVTSRHNCNPLVIHQFVGNQVGMILVCLEALEHWSTGKVDHEVKS